VVQRILVATDRSDTAIRAVEWAAEMSERYAAELVVVQVLAPEHLVGSLGNGDAAAAALADLAARVAGPRGRARLEYNSQPADAIVQVAAEEGADLIVVGNVSMSARTEFLLGSVPNRVSHTAPCSVVIVDTRSGGPAGVPRAQADEKDREPTEGELLARAARIAALLAKYRLGDVLARRDDEDSGDQARAQRFRQVLEELGPTFAKLGQILSTRPDLIPPDFRRELATLQDQVTPLTETEVVEVMEQELRVPWEDVFASIEPQPMASGTIAQVHRAMLVGGERVVIKVQRPTAHEEIGRDLGLLEQLAAKAADRPVFRELVDVPSIIEHLSTSLRRELDFHYEAANLERMRAVLAPFDRLDVPGVHDELSTGRLLVMQEVRGIPIAQAPEGDARRDAGRQMLEGYYQQVLGDGFFHADPHPGNLMWCDGTVYLLDLGMVGEVDAELRRSLLLLLLAFWQEDAAFLAEVMLSLSSERLRPDFDEAGFREELAELIAAHRHLSLKDLRLGPLLEQLTRIALRHGVRLPASVALIGKSFGQMQLAAGELDPSLDPFSVAGSFYARLLAGRLRSSASPRQVFYETQKLRVRAERLLTGIEQVVGARPGAGLRVQMSGDDALTAAINQAGRRIALGLAAGAAMIAAAASASSTARSRWTAPGFGAGASLLTAALLADAIRRR
jgi:ubiquinone biosynthesis protein